MQTNVEQQVANESLRKVEDYIKADNHCRAFAHYLVYLELSPVHRSDHESRFLYISNMCCMLLENRRQNEDVRKCFAQILHYFPANVEVISNYGAFLMRIGSNYEALKQLRLATDLNSDYLPAEKNFMSLKQNVVERWHFRMLNDFHRNDAYKSALQLLNMVEKARVLDIGSGTGILSLLASKHLKIDNIFAVEESKIMCELSQTIFAMNKAEHVQLINKHSNDIVLEDIGGKKCNVLVTEIFDTALFGERILECLIFAWENLLDEHAIVLPCRADLFVIGIQSDQINRRNRLSNTALSLENICLTQRIRHPYDAFDYRRFPFEVMTEKTKAISANFNDLAELKSLYFNLEENTVNLEVIRDGRIDAFLIWFDLYLTESVKISSSPWQNDITCWEQATIFPNHTIEAKHDQVISVNINCYKNKLSLNIPDKVDLKQHKCFTSSTEMIAFLNDNHFINTMHELCNHMKNANLVILDLFQFPLFGLLMARRGAKMICTIADDEDIEFMEYYCEIHNINLDLVNVIGSEELEDYLNYTNLFDVILLNPVNQNGTVNEKTLNLSHALELSLKPNGVIYPRHAINTFELIGSDFVINCNQVNDKNVFGYNIGEVINEFSTQEHWMLEKNFSRNTFSSAISGIDVMQNSSSEIVTNQIIRCIGEGSINAVVYWFRLYFSDNICLDTSQSDFFYLSSFLLDSQLAGDVKIECKLCRGFLKITSK